MKQKEEGEEVNRSSSAVLCNWSRVDQWDTCRREVKLGFDEKKAGSHDGTTLTRFLMMNMGLDYQNQSTA